MSPGAARGTPFAPHHRMRRQAIATSVVGLAVAAAGLVACERSYIYRPAVTTTTSATIAGLPASYYGIPPEAPRGHLRIATLGFAEIRPQGAGDDQELRALHVRMIVANNADRPWLVDTREQRAVLPNGGESRPAYATADRGGAQPPSVEIAPGQARTIDLFYPLPQHMQSAGEVPSFDVLWRVDTAGRAVVDRTPFERIEIYPDNYRESYAWDGPYWYDPYYPRAGAFIGVGLPPVYVGHPVVIHPHVYSAPPARRVR